MFTSGLYLWSLPLIFTSDLYLSEARIGLNGAGLLRFVTVCTVSYGLYGLLRFVTICYDFLLFVTIC